MITATRWAWHGQDGFGKAKKEGWTRQGDGYRAMDPGTAKITGNRHGGEDDGQRPWNVYGNGMYSNAYGFGYRFGFGGWQTLGDGDGACIGSLWLWW